VLLVLLGSVSVAVAKVPRQLKLRFPRTMIAPGANVETCVFIRLPLREAFDLASYQVTQRGFSGTGVAINHFLVYVYTGEHLAEFATRQKQVVPSRGCLDLGPADRDMRQLVILTRAQNSRGTLPPGLSLPLAPVPAAPGAAPDGVGILLDANWINGATKTRAVSALVTLRRAKPRTVRRRLQPILARDADAGIDVPPFALRATESLVDARWRPPGDVCLFDVTSKMHRRGRFFGVELRDGADQVRPPLDGLPNPYAAGRPTLFGATDFTDPDTLRVPAGLLVGAAESLRFGCWHENGDRLPVRLGCETAPGVTPGAIGAPAAPCAPGCTCVPANLVAGDTPDDEVCRLAGFYYDAAPGPSCDLSGLPAIN
jgi:hypothetical protein